ncbi:MAG: hypothetical protein JXA30_14220 [Deltaproteobacteria bacterium]|nr:hypothetical protein [Deltaproteobacteria bacterium]
MKTRIALVALIIIPILIQPAAAQEPDDVFQPDDETLQPDDQFLQPNEEVTQPVDEAPAPNGEAAQPAERPLPPKGELAQPQAKAPPQVDEAPQAAEEPPSVTMKGYFKLQSGLFLPLISDGFKARKNLASIFRGSGRSLTDTGQICDPVETPNIPCYPLDHGQESGSLSMGRGTFQFDLDWMPAKEVKIHATARGVRAVELPADEWAQIPELSENAAERRELAQNWVLDNYYNEFEVFRTLYIDARAAEWLSFRIGRQLWSGTGKYQLLDVVNPKDETWHFGPLESYEETRTPLWMVTSQIDIRAIDHSVELFWVPLLVVPLVDDSHDTVTAPLSLVGAWGIPYSNSPSPFVVAEKVFEYPGNDFEDMRAGLHWKGYLGSQMRYSLLYYFTHQLSPPIPIYFDQRILDFNARAGDSQYLDFLILRFPRQHIAGLSFEFAFENPIEPITPPFGTPAGLVAKLEATVEPDRTYAVRTDANSATGGRYQDPNPDRFFRYYFEPEELIAVTYGVSLTRPFLNPDVPFLLVAQFKHTLVPTYDDVEDAMLVEIPGYNYYKVETSLMQIGFAAAAITLKGFLVPKIIGGIVLPDSAFYSLDLGVNFSANLGIHLTATDFFGENPYERLGLFRDRDEVNMSLTCKF